MDLLKKIISYVIPISKKVPSRYSGTLEISWINGKKLLDTSDANYSYGSLQRVLNYTLDEIDLKQVQDILILGMGGGSVIQSLRKRYRFKGKITAVEIDPEIIEIAKREYNITSNDHTRIWCSDALEFVKKDRQCYDLIIVDITIGKKVPSKFLDTSFWDLLLPRLNSEGYIIFNSMEEAKRIRTLKHHLEKSAKVTEHFDVGGSNQMLIINVCL